MTDKTENEFNSENLGNGMATLRRISSSGVIREDISRSDFEYQTRRQLDFMAGYIQNLLDRIAVLEAAPADVDGEQTVFGSDSGVDLFSADPRGD